MTIRNLIAAAGIDSLDAYLLLGNLLTRRTRRHRGHGEEITKTILLTMNDKQIDKEIIDDFFSLVKRRKDGECVAYIIEKKEFWGLEFFVNKNVLVPRPETEILVECAISGIRGQGSGISLKEADGKIRVLDLCTGSGAIAIALKHELPELEVYATDISGEALEVAQKNAQRLLPNNSNITFLQGDLYKALSPVPCSLFPVPLIVSNPPYIAANEIKTLSPEVQIEPRIALDGGESGLEIIERIIKDAPNYLENGGHLLLEADPRQMESVKGMLANRGFCNIMVYKDLAGLDRVIGGTYEKEK